jgi:nucleotide-binding universal stress UspA family protein
MSNGPILICYDGSAESRHGIEAAAELFASRRAVVLDVASYVTPSESLAVTAAPIGGAEFERLNVEDAKARAEDGAALARTAGLDAEPRAALEAPTWSGVVDVADELDAAVIVIGSRGLDDIGEQLKGSLSHQLVQHSTRPVLVAPPRR